MLKVRVIIVKISSFLKGMIKVKLHRKIFPLNGSLLIGPNSKFILDKGARILIENRFHIGKNSFISNGRSSIIRLDKNSSLSIKGDASVFYGADIILFDNAMLEIGDRTFINSNCIIRCKEKIKIGRDCAISHDCTIMDSNFHKIDGNLETKEVIIGDNVWIGTRVTILNGVKIGNGSIVAAGAVVTKDVPENCVVAGNPAKVIRSDVNWEK